MSRPVLGDPGKDDTCHSLIKLVARFWLDPKFLDNQSGDALAEMQFIMNHAQIKVGSALTTKLAQSEHCRGNKAVQKMLELRRNND